MISGEMSLSGVHVVHPPLIVGIAIIASSSHSSGAVEEVLATSNLKVLNHQSLRILLEQ